MNPFLTKLLDKTQSKVVDERIVINKTPYKLHHVYEGEDPHDIEENSLFLFENINSDYNHKLVNLDEGIVLPFFHAMYDDMCVTPVNYQESQREVDFIFRCFISRFNKKDNVYELNSYSKENFNVLGSNPPRWTIVLGSTILSYNLDNDPKTTFTIEFGHSTKVLHYRCNAWIVLDVSKVTN